VSDHIHMHTFIMNNLNESWKASLLFSNRVSEKICRRRKKKSEKISIRLLIQFSLYPNLTTFSRLNTFSSFISAIAFDRRDRQSQLDKRHTCKKSLSLFTRHSRILALSSHKSVNCNIHSFVVVYIYIYV